MADKRINLAFRKDGEYNSVVDKGTQSLPEYQIKNALRFRRLKKSGDKLGLIVKCDHATQMFTIKNGHNDTTVAVNGVAQAEAFLLGYKFAKGVE